MLKNPPRIPPAPPRRILNPRRFEKEPRQSKSFPPAKIVLAKPSPHFAPPHCPETSRAEPRKKNTLSFFKRNSPPPNQESKEHFSLVLPSEARQWRDDSFHIGILLEKSSDFVVQREQQKHPCGVFLLLRRSKAVGQLYVRDRTDWRFTIVPTIVANLRFHK